MRVWRVAFMVVTAVAAYALLAAFLFVGWNYGVCDGIFANLRKSIAASEGGKTLFPNKIHYENALALEALVLVMSFSFHIGARAHAVVVQGAPSPP